MAFELPATARPPLEPGERPATRLKTSQLKAAKGPTSPTESRHDSDCIARVDDPQITIDGFVDGAAWEQIQVIDQFTVLNPDTLGPTDTKHKHAFFTMMMACTAE